MDAAGLTIIAFMFFLLTFLFLVGFFYDNEFSQAVFFLAAPLSLLGAVQAWACRKAIATNMLSDVNQIYRLLSRYRLFVQVVGVIDLAVASIWGILVNLSNMHLGG